MVPSTVIKTTIGSTRTLVYTHASPTPALIFGQYSNILGVDARLIVEVENSGGTSYELFDRNVAGADYAPNYKSGRFPSEPWLATGDKLYITAAAGNQSVLWEDVGLTVLWEDIGLGVYWENVGYILSGSNAFNIILGVAI